MDKLSFWMFPILPGHTAMMLTRCNGDDDVGITLDDSNPGAIQPYSRRKRKSVVALDDVDQCFARLGRCGRLLLNLFHVELSVLRTTGPLIQSISALRRCRNGHYQEQSK
jgi:hypothetical protein